MKPTSSSWRVVGRDGVVFVALAALGAACADRESTPTPSHPVVSWDANDLEQWSLAQEANFVLDEDELGFLAGMPAGLFGVYPGQYEAGRQRVPYSVVRWRSPDSLAPVGSIAGQDYYFGPGGRGIGFPPVRFNTTVAAGNGVLFVSEGDARLTVLDGMGAVRLEVRVAGTGVELGGEVRSRVTDSLYALVARSPVRMARRLESAPLPERTDGFDATVLARDGTLWMGGRSIPGIERRLWINLEQDGAPVRRLQLPRSVVVLDADEDRLLLTTRDDLGVYHVEVRQIVSRT